MKEIFYNGLQNARIKNIALGLLLLLANATFLYMVDVRNKQGYPTSLATALVICFSVIMFLFFIARIPFEQVVGISDDKSFATYYKLGPYKFKYRQFDCIEKVTIEQNEKRFYCLTLTTLNGCSIIIEKYPTLDKANERLNEFRQGFDK